MRPKRQPLDDYRRKRAFDVTPEPRGRRQRASALRPRFVIQKHDASRLHYDFRLEVDGVLKSWAVPKGPSLDPRQKRLAIATEDHPLEYATFEGVIPPGQYGAGAVLVWDQGAYSNTKKDRRGKLVSLEQCLRDGHLTIRLKGKKLKGAFALTRLSAPDQWLLVKVNDEDADSARDPLKTHPDSVLTGRSLDDIRADYFKRRRSGE